MSVFEVKRFWSEVATVPVEGGFGLELDGRPLKTPRKRLVMMPDKSLADEMRIEWEKVDGKVDKFVMPYTRFSEAAVDAATDERKEICAKLALYGGNDLLCYRAPNPAELVARQKESWDSLLEWAATELHAPLLKSEGIVHVEQPAQSLDRLAGLINELGAFRLTALYDLVILSGSLVLGLAVSTGRLNADQAWHASRIDEQWQIDQWGPDDEAEKLLAPKKRAFEVAAHATSVLDKKK